MSINHTVSGSGVVLSVNVVQFVLIFHTLLWLVPFAPEGLKRLDPEWRGPWRAPVERFEQPATPTHPLPARGTMSIYSSESSNTILT